MGRGGNEAEYVDVRASQTCTRSAFVQVDGIESNPKNLNKIDEQVSYKAIQ